MIVAINHISHVDTVLMARLIWQSGRIPRFLVKAGLFDIVGIGAIMRGAKQIPVYRGTSDASNSLREAVTALERGEAVIFYPEGTITKDPEQWPMEAKTGIARLVLLCPDIPVVPVGQWGAQVRRGRAVVAAGAAPPSRRIGRATVGPVAVQGPRTLGRDAPRDHRRDHGRGPRPGR